MHHADHIRDAIDRAARQQGYTASTLSDGCGGDVSADHVEKWITGRASMVTAKAHKLMKLLKLKITEEE